MSAGAAGSPAIALPGLDADLDRLDRLARDIAAAWAPRTLAATTVGRERALIRLFGATGLDAAGAPLAGTVVDRYLAGPSDRLARGVALPFAMAIAEYDEPAQQLALDVAAGHVDLGREAELLADPDRRMAAESALRTLLARALERIDANRTARRELRAVLGDPVRPWLSTSVTEADARRAAAEARELAGAGFDVVRVEVPMGRELSGLLEAAGIPVEGWQAEPPGDTVGPGRGGLRGIGRGTRGGSAQVDVGSHSGDDLAPAGSQRGLAAIRPTIDEAAAERRGYVRLASAASPLAAPEQAVVAAFERVDLVVADAMSEIVASSVDPDRALADHAFAAGLHRRAGTLVQVGPGPLVVAPDLAAGLPSDAATRSARALALQLVGIHLARAAGLPADQIVAGGVPGWTADERLGPALSLAEVALRRRLLGEHSLWFAVPRTPGESGLAALTTVAGVAPADEAALLVHLALDGTDPATAARAGRAALGSGSMLERSRSGASLAGVALDHARATTRAAIRTLEALAGDGWRSILGEAFDDPEGRRFGADAVTERADPRDPLAAVPPHPGETPFS